MLKVLRTVSVVIYTYELNNKNKIIEKKIAVLLFSRSKNIYFFQVTKYNKVIVFKMYFNEKIY